MYSEAFNSLMQNEAFVREMLAQRTEEDVQRLYAENGVELSMEDVREIGKMLDSFDKEGEIGEDELDAVAGGSLALGWAIAKAVIAVGSAGLAIYKWYKSR